MHFLKVKNEITDFIDTVFMTRCLVKKRRLLGLPWWSSGKESTFQCRDVGSSPGRGTKIPHATGQLSLRATTTEFVCLNETARMPPTTELMCSGTRAPQLERENPHVTTREKPTPQRRHCVLQLRSDAAKKKKGGY